MLQHSKAFSGFSVDDVGRAKQFYGDTLGLRVEDGEMGIAELHFADGHHAIVYPKPNHEPASFTILNFPVDDIEKVVDELTRAGSSSRSTSGSTPRASTGRAAR
jgi:predicted enzyme related to lactoylglutathione lyase